jgi:formamidopyrimidine-DNA glycosylase
MPELPEVNTVVLALDHHFRGDAIVQWRKLSPKLRRPVPDADLLQAFFGAKIEQVFRQAKSIYFSFAVPGFLHFHLGMTGFFTLDEKAEMHEKHCHLQIVMKSQRVLNFHDPRRFGVVELLEELPEKVPEPFLKQLSLPFLRRVVSHSSRPIKLLIMDQAIIAGVGNIYASEALFAAGIRPDRPADSLALSDITNLRRALCGVIKKSIESGQQSLRPNYPINAETAHFDIETRVYGRDGQLCPKCGKHTIEKIILGGRSSFFCGICQR